MTGPAAPTTTGTPIERLRQAGSRIVGSRWVAVLLPFVSVGAITVLNSVLSDLVAITNISMLYLAAVVVSAVAGGGLSAVVAAALSSLAYNFFFIEPRSSFTVARPDELLALVVFVIVALVTGSLAAQMRKQAAVAREQARAARELYEFSRGVSGALSVGAVGETIVRTLGELSNAAVLLLLPNEGGTLEVVAASGVEPRLAKQDLMMAQQAYSERAPASRAAGAIHGAQTLHVLTSGVRRLGVVVMIGAESGRPKAAAPHLAAMLEQAAVAIDRALWARQSTAATVTREAQKLQSALLSSLSHDLKTPLASITGAATSLQQLGSRMDEATRNDLLQSIAEDANRLNRFVGNLFDMTRIESGSLKVRRETIDVGEIALNVLRRAQQVHPGLPIDLKVETDLPPASGDAILVEQALFNIIDNAHKYAGADRPVSIRASAAGGTVRIAVADSGPGIPEPELERIFDKFYRRAKGDGRPAGTGLGLSIARGFISAMGGSIRAESPVHGKRGTRFVIGLPAAQAGRP